MIVYKIHTELSDKFYIGITSNLQNRIRAHKYSAKVKSTKLYSFMRKYGFENMVFSILHEVGTREEACALEIKLIAELKPELNLARGGEGGYVVPEEEKEEWRKKLSTARQGRKPALGMKHTKENKKAFGVFGRLRWDKYGRYPKEVVEVPFSIAFKQYGISKTHYYRLLKQVKGNDLG